MRSSSEEESLEKEVEEVKVKAEEVNHRSHRGQRGRFHNKYTTI